MYRDQFKDYFGEDGVGIRGTSDAICMEHGLSVIEPSEPLKGPVSRAELEATGKGKPTVRGLIRRDIDAALAIAPTYKAFLQQLRRQGYEIKYGPNVKHTTVRPPWGKGNIRLDGLGAGYTEADIQARLAAIPDRKAEPSKPPTLSPPSTWLIPGRRYHARDGLRHRSQKLHGFRARYFMYLYLLGAIPKRRPRNRTSQTVKKDPLNLLV